MARIKWTPQAVEDIHAICNYIGCDSPHYAKIFANRIVHSGERLKQFPYSARIAHKIEQDNLREIVIYRVKEDIVQLLTVHHSARLIDPAKSNE
jgi:plasmid stabilization system protein ParE